MDENLRKAEALIERARSGAAVVPSVKTFFDEPTFTATYVVRDPGSQAVAIVDSVLDFDAASGRTSTTAADRIVDYVLAEGLTVEWLLETHVHADHLSAAPYLQSHLGGNLAIGRQIVDVQEIFGSVFNVGAEFKRDGSQFDRLFDDGDSFSVGGLQASVLHVPGLFGVSTYGPEKGLRIMEGLGLVEVT